MSFVDDTLRERLAQALHYQLRPEGVPWPRGEGPATKRMYTLADALLPLIREHVAAAVQVERERVAQAIDEATPHMTVVGAHGMEIAARIARLDPEQVDTP